MAKDTYSATIISGPDRMDLVHSMIFRRKATFVLQGPTIEIQAVDVIINTIQAESGDGHSWNLIGYVDTGAEFKAYYRTKSKDPKQTETGHAEIEVKPGDALSGL